MIYELVKRLKDLGFPLVKIKGGMNVSNRECVDLNPERNEKIGEQHFFIPILSEIIEACGDKFLNLEHFVYGQINTNEWRANYCQEKDEYEADGQTPEEAVANLWIKLKNYGSSK